MTHILSSFFRFICIIFIFEKIISKQNVHKAKIMPYSISMSFLFMLTTYIDDLFPTISLMFSILLFSFITIAIYNIKGEISFITTVISHTTFYILNYFSSFITLVLLCPLYYFNKQQPYLLLALLTGILTLILSHLLFKNKRIQTGVKYFFTSRFSRPFFIVCLLILFAKTLDNYYTYNYIYQSDVYIDLYLPILIIFLGILLFTWWRKQITKSYIEKLRKLEVQSLYDELEEKERLIKKLTADNESLSRIIHKDNKLIPAMENAVTDFLSDNVFNDPDKLKQYGQELTRKLQDMAQDRQGILASYENESHKLRLTGRVSLDAILVYMQKKAEANHITFECKHSSESIDYLLSKISEDDLTHLLSDLIENALIATSDQSGGRIQITFGKFQKEAYIAVADNGVSFDITTLHSLGLQPHTTRENSGGSGIGLMDIWKIKRKYRATIQIQEYEKSANNFTKKILFSFNSKNHYVIQSFRHTEISNTQTRGDLYVIPADTKETNEDKKHERSN